MKKIIITVGPAINKFLKQLECKNYIYRVNGSHLELTAVKNSVQKIRENISNVEILLDLPGNKVRTCNLKKPVLLKIGKKFSLSVDQINCPQFCRYIKVKDTVLAADSTLKFMVHSVDDKEVVFLSQSNGYLFNNKGLHVHGINKKLPFLFGKDHQLISLANELKVDYVGLSFVRSCRDIKEARGLLDGNIKLITKVETKSALDNLNSILQEVEYILVDRGDLSAEIGLEKVPRSQEFIIDKALFYNKKVFLATQFLTNMIDKPIPSIAEVISLYSTFKTGIYGIQLSEETAIGKYPLECLKVIEKILSEIKAENQYLLKS
ncbi:MAG: hypothetical protein A2173_03630 [Planctomycetes bacterium RBG_13_44_8b]|nr:MAG: hypothetical protein A2173_03630 [Planctomycetes bacterium RBG_13_44_8b]